MPESAAEQTFPAIAFVIRSRVYAVEQRGRATLLPWLQRFSGASPAPGLPEWCLGLLNVRGTVQVAIDLGNVLGLGQSQANDNSRLIFIELGSAQLGMLVDAEIGVRNLRWADASESGEGSPFYVGTALLDAREVTVLDGAAIIRFVAAQLGASV
jgi:chemotaxis signal transduction protein